MITINTIKVLSGHQIHFRFSDGTEKTIDFTPYISSNPLTAPLSDPEYFSQVKIYENGRGIYWPNEYDFCPDFLRHYGEDIAA
jgi:hypothetical protein